MSLYGEKWTKTKQKWQSSIETLQLSIRVSMEHFIILRSSFLFLFHRKNSFIITYLTKININIFNQIIQVLCEFVRRKTNKNEKVKMMKCSIETLINFLLEFLWTVWICMDIFTSFLSVQSQIKLIICRSHFVYSCIQSTLFTYFYMIFQQSSQFFQKKQPLLVT